MYTTTAQYIKETTPDYRRALLDADSLCITAERDHNNAATIFTFDDNSKLKLYSFTYVIEIIE